MNPSTTPQNYKDNNSPEGPYPQLRESEIFDDAIPTNPDYKPQYNYPPDKLLSNDPYLPNYNNPNPNLPYSNPPNYNNPQYIQPPYNNPLQYNPTYNNPAYNNPAYNNPPTYNYNPQYSNPNPVPYNQPTYQNPNSNYRPQIIIATTEQNTVPQTIFSHESQCKSNIYTNVKYEAGGKTHLFACLGCLFAASICCCLVPYCLNECQDAHHYCPMCNKKLGVQEF